jgi:hypothetical protein
VMKFEGFLRHVGGERVIRIGQFGQDECHWSYSSM